MILYVLITTAVLALAYYGCSMEKAGRPVQTYSGQAGTHPAGTASSSGSGPVFRQTSLTRGKAVMALCLAAIAVVLIVPAVLRQATGNDYMRYVEFFHLAFVDAYVPTEPGFNLMCKIVYTLCGYENYLLMFALFSIATVVLFMVAIRQQAEDFLFSFFLFMMFAYYFHSYNTVRYYFALSLVLFSLRGFLEKRYVEFLLCILLAASFHKSALIVFLLYPAAVYTWKKWQLIGCGVLGAGFIAFQNVLMKVIIRLYPSYEDTEILAAGGSISYANIVKCLLILALVWIVRKEINYTGRSPEDKRLRFYINCTWIALTIYVFGYFIPEISRIGYYLMITQIFLIPSLIRRIPCEKARLRRLAAGGVCVLAALSFAAFLHTANDSRIRILPYKTFLFNELPDTPSRSIEK